MVHALRPGKQPLPIGSVVDAASQRAGPVSPDKIVVIYGAGLGPMQLVQNQANDGRIGAEVGGTKVSIGGVDAPLLYSSATQVAAIVAYGAAGTTIQVSVSYQGQVSNTVDVPLVAAAPSLFTVNQTGAGQAAGINFPNTFNTAVEPVKVGEFISLYARGEGQTVPAGGDGQVVGSTPTHPLPPVSVMVDGLPASGPVFGRHPGSDGGPDAGECADSEWCQAWRVGAGRVESWRGREQPRGMDCGGGELILEEHRDKTWRAHVGT